MQPVSLEEIIPEKPEFELNGKLYQLRTMNIEDRTWMIRTFGGAEAVSEMFRAIDWSKLSILLFRLLIEKKDFLPFDEEGVDDDGESIRIRVTGPVRLQRAISGLSVGMKLISALTAAISNGDPVMKEQIKLQVKKSLLDQPTGQKSLISSPASTGTRSRKSKK